MPTARPGPDPTTHRAGTAPPVASRTRMATLDALRAFAAGHKIPAGKYSALQRAALIKVRGHGPRSKPYLTDCGAAALAQHT